MILIRNTAHWQRKSPIPPDNGLIFLLSEPSLHHGLHFFSAQTMDKEIPASSGSELRAWCAHLHLSLTPQGEGRASHFTDEETEA